MIFYLHYLFQCPLNFVHFIILVILSAQRGRFVFCNMLAVFRRLIPCFLICHLWIQQYALIIMLLVDILWSCFISISLSHNYSLLQASPVMIGERQCYVEEKRTNGSRGKLIQLQILSFSSQKNACLFILRKNIYLFLHGEFMQIALLEES
jgi:hypothetical protein